MNGTDRSSYAFWPITVDRWDIDMSNEETKKRDKELDRTIEQSFPASDPAPPKHITGTEEPGSDINRKAPKITRQQVEAAANPTGRSPEPAKAKPKGTLPEPVRERAED